MSEDSPSNQPDKKSWLERFTNALSGEPRTRGDLINTLREARKEGLMGPDTLKMMEGALSVAESQVSDVMVPRAQMISLPVEESLDQLLLTVVESGHSRFPVHGEDRDEIIGVLLAKDLLRVFTEQDRPTTIHAMLRPAVLIPESKRLNVLLKEFRLSRNHMAIVVDEYGGVAGLVTIEDVLEQIVGEIDDEHDDATDQSQQIAAQADGQYVVEALTPIEDFNERFGANFPDDEYDTIGGLITSALGHLPEADEELSLDRFNFRVASADERRVHTFVVSITGES